MKRKFCLMCTFVLLFGFVGSTAASVWWTGAGGDNYWSNPGNWGPDDGDGFGYYVADTAGSTILVDATHSATAGTGARIGYNNGIGGNPVTVNITGGSLTSGETRLAYYAGGACVINVSGTGQFINTTYIRSSYSTTLTNSTVSISDDGYISVGTYWRHSEKGQGHITIEDNGLLEIVDYLDLADSSGDGYLNIYDNGKLVVGGLFDVGAKVGSASGTTTVNLHDGTIQAGSLDMVGLVPGDYAGLIDIELGELLLKGDLRSDTTLLGWISSDYIVGYAGTGSVVVGTSLVDIGGVDYTLITAIPEPATVMLLGLGGLALIRRKRAR